MWDQTERAQTLNVYGGNRFVYTIWGDKIEKKEESCEMKFKMGEQQ